MLIMTRMIFLLFILGLYGCQTKNEAKDLVMINDSKVLAEPLLYQIEKKILKLEDSCYIGIDSQLIYRNIFFNRFSSDSNYVKASVLFLEEVNLTESGVYYDAMIILGDDRGDLTIYNCTKAPRIFMDFKHIRIRKQSYTLSTEYGYFIMENYLFNYFYFPELKGVLDDEVNGVYTFGRFDRLLRPEINIMARKVYYKGSNALGGIIIGLDNDRNSVNHRMIQKILLDLDNMFLL